MRYTHFTVHCGGCSYNARPAQSPREGVRKVLSGEFSECPACKAKFVKIRVPKRPLVEDTLRTLPSLSAIVELVSYSGTVPRALGFVRVS